MISRFSAAIQSVSRRIFAGPGKDKPADLIVTNNLADPAEVTNLCSAKPF